MKIFFPLLYSIFATDSFSATIRCNDITAKKFFVERKVKTICSRGQTYFSKNCYEDKGCNLMDRLRLILNSGRKLNLVSSIGSPNYKLCYDLESTPVAVTFQQSTGRQDQKLVCISDDGSFMESEVLLEIYYSLSL